MERIIRLSILVLFAFVLTGCTEQANNELVVGLECNYAPFNWTTSVDSEETEKISQVNAYCDGYDITVARKLALELDLDLVIRKIEWDGLIPALLSGEIDVIIAGMSPTEERQLTVNFTDEYYKSEQVLVVKSNSTYASATQLSDFSGASVVAQLGTLQDDLIDQITTVNHLTALTDYPSLVVSVSSGVADAFVAELPVAQSMVASNPDLTIVTLGDSGFTVLDDAVSVSVAVRKEDTTLQEDINTILAEITAETRNNWMSDALTRQP